jgi:biopolymer transport protein ExbD
MSRRRTPDKPVKVDVPITPMLDMSFQLLFFFILSYDPNVVVEGQMEMALPAKIEYAKKDQENPDPVPSDKEEELTLEPDLTVVVKTQNDGVNNGIISQITLKDLAGEKSVRNLDELTARLREAREKEGLKNHEEVKIQGDSGLNWGAVVEVMDACQKAGFRAGFAEPPDRSTGAP